MQSLQVLLSFHFRQPEARHFIVDFQRERSFFVQADVGVFQLSGEVAHEEGLQQHRLVFNGRKALVIVQKQSLQPGQAERHSELEGEAVQRLGEV